MDRFSQVFNEVPLAEVHDLAARRAEEGWRYVQILAVNTEEGIDLVYSYMKDGLLENDTVAAVGADDAVPSITDLFLEAFVCENEIHDLYGVAIENIAIDFGGMFYQLAEKAPMTVVSPEQLAAREKAKKIAAAKAAKEAAAQKEQVAPAAPAAVAGPTEEEIQAKIAGLDPEKAAKVRAALEAKAAKAAAAAVETAPAPSAALTEEEIQAKIAGLDPEKAAKVRAALEAKAAKAAKTEGKGE
ncbi:NADH-quinone oxidoreductase subunit C [Adlercreutzia muris]|uniref:NADH-quinone oxidoreductase subunit C n=1 Tax=Adlercreutzia muris TaxID=1796610 RepID=A0A7C8BQX1_9ACTN|nr:NADH-quinone oxidoreductase subunit C [Adlercreutzia muris]KAB1643713.1 NADH-quinone oxidoreductase subunit C [Adlercreutzia muris]MCR2027176.1 NADH-quinone oxidoreductase subunit C [Adlercreutzia muris]MCU7585084.1 NADH-quinone oxidoreductase subunit C [Adlercreutzia muris]